MRIRTCFTYRALILGLGVFGLTAMSLSQSAEASVATYKLTVKDFWDQSNHKDSAPLFSSVSDPHFSHLGGGTHNDQLVVWEDGELSGPGMILMQEEGWIDKAGTSVDLKGEFDTHIANETAFSFLNYPMHFQPFTPVELSLDVSSTHPLVSLVSMLGPTPDWFVGVSGLSMRDAGGWIDRIDVDLFTYDGGSRSRDDQFALFGPLENPQQPIRLITDEDDTLLKGSVRIGKFKFELESVIGINGDTDGDGDVDDADLAQMFGNFTGNVGAAGGKTVANGDTDEDGDVDNTDIGAGFGNYTGALDLAAAGSRGVPEPSTLVLTMIGLFATMAHRRRRINP